MLSCYRDLSAKKLTCRNPSKRHRGDVDFSSGARNCF